MKYNTRNYQQAKKRLTIYYGMMIIGLLIILAANVIFLCLPGMWATLWAGVKEIWEMWVIGFVIYTVAKLKLTKLK